MKRFKVLSMIAIATVLSSGASAFWLGEGVDTNGPYKVYKYSYNTSCADLKEMINEEGAVVIYESANPPLYKKYVKSDMWCDSQETTHADSVMALDGKCWLKECVDNSHD